MRTILSRLENALRPALAAIVAGVGAATGGGVYVSFSGLLLGIVLALGLTGFLAVVASLIGRIAGATGEQAPAPLSKVREPRPAVAAATPFVPSSPQPAAVALGASPPQSAAPDITESESSLLAAGRFAEYHLTKAKRLLAARNFKDAAHHAAASLAHGDLPEAVSVRKAALAGGS